MNRANRFRSLATAVILLGCLHGPVFAADEGDYVRPSAAASNTSRARQLAADVRELAIAPGLSRAKREKRIATAVRTAVVAATAYRHDGPEMLGAATELAAAAAHAAPAYAEIITNAAALAPGVARIDGAAGAIRAAALNRSRGKGTQKLRSRSEAVAAAPARATSRRALTAARRAEPEYEPESASEAPAAEESPGAMADEYPVANTRGRGAAVSDQRVALSLTTDLVVRREDNVYLSNTDKVEDTTVSAIPGISMRWGQSARSGGSISISEAFNRYLDKTSPNVALAHASLSAGYQGAASATTVGASYQQLHQSNTDTEATGRTGRVRSSSTGANASFEASPWAKLGFRAGGSYARTSYRNEGLIGNRRTSLPLDVLFHVTPKTNLSLGYTYGTQRPDGDGLRSKDHYLNLGASGEFTAKLSGSFNVGYQSRRVGEEPSDHILAFTGSFNYELTPKTGLTLAMSRNFNISARGATTKNTAFRLGLQTGLTPQWSLAAHAAFLDNQYGTAVNGSNTPAGKPRTDHAWETDLTSTYLFTDWFSTSLSYFFRNNRSTLDSVDFTSNAVSLSLGLRY